MADFPKKYKLKITLFSPVHVGASSELEPTNYVICSENKTQNIGEQANETLKKIKCPECGEMNLPNAKFYQFCEEPLSVNSNVAINKERIIESSYLYTFNSNVLDSVLDAASKNILLDIVKKGKLIEIQKFFKQKALLISKKGVKRSIVSNDIAKAYQEKLGNVRDADNEFCKFAIEKNVFDEVLEKAYIPGSSMKGSIRTALLNLKQKEKRLFKNNYDLSKKNAFDQIQKDLYDYRDVKTDPFKFLKISDLKSIESFLTKICQQVNLKRKSALASKTQIKSYIEVIPKNIQFESYISIDDSKIDNIENIRKACNVFYKNILDYEMSIQTKNHGISEEFFSQIEQFTMKTNSFILRVGKHSGAESVTVEGFREIKLKKEKSEHATTYWYCDDGFEKLPFGWIGVEYIEVR